MRARTVLVISANASFAEVVTSPTTCTWPVVTSVSTATRDLGSSASSASSTESLIASQILSGCPSVTDSLVNSRPSLTVHSSRYSSLKRKLDSQIITLSHVAAVAAPLVAPKRAVLSCATLTRIADMYVQSPAAVVQERHDRVHDTAGHQSFRTVLHRGLGAIGCEQPSVVAVHLECTVLADGVDDKQVAALAGELGTGVKQHVAIRVAGLCGEPDDRTHVGQLPVGARLHRPRQHVVCSGELDRGRLRGALLDLVGLYVHWPKV